MSNYLLEAFGNPHDEDANTSLRPPFGYPGGKTKLASKIVEYLPATSRYIEPFGGSAAVLLKRAPSKFEVFNDRYAGVCAFYRVMRQPSQVALLEEMCELSVMSKEEFYYCKETWEKCTTDIDRAFRWLYMVSYSFGGMGRNWGLGKATTSAGKLRRKNTKFWPVHERFKHVQVDNADWRICMENYDHPDSVFYLDPPYLGADNNACYEHSKISYEDLMSQIAATKGFVALSGYPNPIFDNQSFWTDRVEWDKHIDIQSYKHEGQKRGKATEVLWIKEAE